MSAVEKETRLEAILPDTTSLCDQIETKSRELKELLEGFQGEQAALDGDGEEVDIDLRMERDVFVLQQVCDVYCIFFALDLNPWGGGGRVKLLSGLGPR